MNRDETLAHVAAVMASIAPEVDLSTIDPTARLREEADIDSMDFLRLLAGLKARTGVEVAEADYARVASLDGLLAQLQAHAG